MTDGLREQIENGFKPDERAFVLARTVLPPKEKQPTKMKKWSCGCTNIRVAVELHAVCTSCENIFRMVEEEK